MTYEEKQIINMLITCSFLPGSNDKKFVYNMKAKMQYDYQLSDKQKTYLYKLLHRYRKQIGIQRHSLYCTICGNQQRALPHA
jgi:hypothetical protein